MSGNKLHATFDHRVSADRTRIIHAIRQSSRGSKADVVSRMSNIASGIVKLATIWPVVVFAGAALGNEPPATMPAESQAVADMVEASPQADPQAAPLLRETSQIVDVQAEIRRDASGAWLAVIARPNSPDIPFTFTLMPGTRLAELQRLTESSQATSGAIHLSGQLYVYRDKNYLLPTHVTIVTAPAPTSQSTAPASQPSTQSAVKSTESSAARVLRELDQAAGSRVTGAGGAGGVGGVGGTRGAAESKSQSGKTDASRAKTIREGVVITNRRGKLSRDGSGAWVFVFDADAHGQSDPPMKILPCLLLERMEDYARRIGGHVPAILNGTVYLYRGQNFLLPTVFLIPQDRRNITP